MLSKVTLHAREVAAQAVLSADAPRAREVVRLRGGRRHTQCTPSIKQQSMVSPAIHRRPSHWLRRLEHAAT